MSRQPSPNRSNGRDAKGRFTRGNAGGPGNPHAAHVARLRSMLLQKVDADALGRILDALVSAAENGDVQAARLVLNYGLGEPAALDLIQRVEALESVLTGLEARR
jgi:hypothetical protein